MHLRKNVRVPLIAVGIVLLGYSFLIASPKTLVRTSSSMLSNAVVGMSAGVGVNPENTLAQQLRDKETELTLREAALLARVEVDTEPRGFFDSTAVYSFGLSLILFALVAYNYYLDWKRGRRKNSPPSTLVVS